MYCGYIRRDSGISGGKAGKQLAHYRGKVSMPAYIGLKTAVDGVRQTCQQRFGVLPAQARIGDGLPIR